MLFQFQLIRQRNKERIIMKKPTMTVKIETTNSVNFEENLAEVIAKYIDSGNYDIKSRVKKTIFEDQEKGE